MSIKRVTVEVKPCARPFKEGETLITYANRIIKEDGLDGEIISISGGVSFQDVSTHLSTPPGSPSFWPVNEVVEIEVRTAAMVR